MRVVLIVPVVVAVAMATVPPWRIQDASGCVLVERVVFTPVFDPPQAEEPYPDGNGGFILPPIRAADVAWDLLAGEFGGLAVAVLFLLRCLGRRERRSGKATVRGV